MNVDSGIECSQETPSKYTSSRSTSTISEHRWKEVNEEAAHHPKRTS